MKRSDSTPRSTKELVPDHRVHQHERATTRRVLIPLTIRKRNGRPKIVPSADMALDAGGVHPHTLKTIAEAWSWRRKLETGAAATIQDADSESTTHGFVGWLLKLAYLALAVLNKLFIECRAPGVLAKELIAAMDLILADQEAATFGDRRPG